MSGTVKWKLDNEDSRGKTTEFRPVANSDAIAWAVKEALDRHAREITIHWDETPPVLPKSWTIEWGTAAGIGHCYVEGSEIHLTIAVSELLKRSPSEVSIAESLPGQIELPPYRVIARALKGGDVVPFLGAGVSASARDKHAEWSDESEFPPTGAELSEYLVGSAAFPFLPVRERSDLKRVASFYSLVAGSGGLRETLRDLFYDYSTPGPLHNELAEVPHPLLIVTTNYDALMEDALRRTGKPFDVVTHCTDRTNEGKVLYWKHGAIGPEYVLPGKLDIDLLNTTVVYKMHGSVDRFGAIVQPRPTPRAGKSHAHFVITEEDYIDLLRRMGPIESVIPAIFMEYFDSKSFLFLGYGLRDWNFRVVLENLGSALPTRKRAHAYIDIEEDDRPHWAIQKHPTDADRRLWTRRNVEIYDSDLNDFTRHLHPFLST